MVKRRTGLDPLSYMGVEPSTPSQFVQEPRNPTTNDYDGFLLMNVWLNTVTQQVWMLVNKNNFVATWREFTSAAGAVNTLTADTGTNPVPPTGNNIDLFGGTGIGTVGTAAASLITINVDASVALQYDCDVGSAIPVANVLNVVGDGTYITTAGAGNTITISPSGSVAIQVDADVGSATPALGILNAFGGFNISTIGAGNTLTFNLTGTTNHAVQIGNVAGSLTSLAVGTDGQVLIGATGADPAFATMTSTGGTILFTPGANSLNLETAGAPTTIVTDSGSATVAAGILNVVGGDNISTSGAGNTVTVAVSGTGNFNPQMGNASGSLSDIGAMTDGDLIIGSTGLAPQVAQLTAGMGIGIVNAAGSITISATGASVGDTIVTTFTSSGTWTKNANTKYVTYYIYSGGGGGGSGGRGAADVSGGQGGGSGGTTVYSIPGDLIGATESVTIAASASGGAAQTVDSTDGNDGGAWNISTFGTTFPVPGGTLTAGGTIGGGQGGKSNGQTTQGGGSSGAGQYQNNQGFVNGGLIQRGGVGFNLGGSRPAYAEGFAISLPGGGGGGVNGGAGTGGGDGGVGSFFITPGIYTYGTPASGGAAGVSGTNGNDMGTELMPYHLAGTGGGGGGGHPTAPGDGGDGGAPGGGGGAGGASSDGSDSGAGGDGAQGRIVIVEFTGT